MQKRLLVTAESGLVVFRDAHTENPASDRREDTARRLLREGEQDGSWFFLDADDTVIYRVVISRRRQHD